ncbi:Asp23/Gls24 family envelope stress response protein [Olsenella umbonata]|uniref:Asp23/Gls24 family envelope stress response protein n=1 Tax=Parafannyhessea umbonata TaxID=604330 RepID=A0A6N7WSR0_9ACTN|nr:Asp23/Gls24 family envelope stress response protein [Parafannyhessea umbonata]
MVASVEATDEAEKDEAPASDAKGEAAATSDADATAEGEAPDAQADADAEEDLDGEDSLTFSNGVIEKIVAIAMHDVPGVIGMKGGWLNRVQDVIGVSDSRKGVSVEVTPDASVRVNISVLIEYGAYAPQVFEDVKKAVVKNVTGMTGLSVAGVNLRIEDVLTPDEVAARNKAEKVAEDKALAEAAEAATAAGDEAAE